MGDKILQNLQSITFLMSRVKCNHWDFNVKEHKGSPYLQITFEAPDNTNPSITETQYCRKWALQYTMSDSEVIRTAHMAARQAIIHEIDEQFTFDGEMIFSPHMSVHKLVELRRIGREANDVRIPETDNGVK